MKQTIHVAAVPFLILALLVVSGNAFAHGTH